MNLRRWLAILSALLVFAGGQYAGPVWAQGDVNLSIDEVNHESYPEITIRTTVRNGQGIPIAGVQPDQFSIIEDMQRTLTLGTAEAVVNPDTVVSVLFAIDISGSMKGEHIEQAIRAANEFMDRLNEADRVALVAFADRVDVNPSDLEDGKEHGFTTDKNAIRNVINFLNSRIDPDSDTPLYDAIYKAVKLTSGEPVGKRAILVMTDGREEGKPKQGTGSLFTGDDAIGEASRSRVPVFTIGLGTEIDSAYLRRLALLTGGEYQETPDPEQLTTLTQNVLDQLKQQYVLRFETGLPYDARPHSFIVRVSLPQGEAMADHEFAFQEESPTAETAPSEGVVPTPEPSATEVKVTSTAAETEEAIAQVRETREPEPTDVVSQPASEVEPGSGRLLGDIRDKVEEMMDSNPVLLIGIGVGVLILLALIIALVVVVVRGRRRQKAAVAGARYEEPLAPLGGPSPMAGYGYEGRFTAEGDWTAGPGLAAPTPSATPLTAGPLEGRTEAAPADWGVARPEQPPFGQPPVAYPAAAPLPGIADQDEIPLAGGTRVIERRSGQAASLVDRSDPGRRFRLSGTVTIGRGTDNQIVLTHPTVSRRHAWLREEVAGWLVGDAGSANGTFVNGQRVSEPRPVKNGDVVSFGKAEYLFEVFGA